MRIAVLIVASLAACSSTPAGTIDAYTDGTHAIDGEPFAGLVAHYTMDALAAVAPQLADDSSNGHTGMCTSCPTLVDGKDGQGYQFLGTTQIVTIAGGGALRTESGFTVTAWFQFAAPHTGCFVNKVAGTADKNSWQACVQSSGVVTFYTDGPAGGGSLASSVLSLDAWHHVGLVWDGTTKSLYVDGAFAASIGNSPTSFDDGDVTLGGDLDSGALAAPFNGLLDEVRIYNRALAPAAIAVLATP